MALTQLWLISSPTPTWGCPIPRGRHELAVTDHTAPPTWVQTGQLGASALYPLHTCPTRLRKLSSHLRVGVHVPGCPQPPIPAGMATSVTELPSTPTLWAVSGGQPALAKRLLCPTPLPPGLGRLSPVSVSGPGSRESEVPSPNDGCRGGQGCHLQSRDPGGHFLLQTSFPRPGISSSSCE